MIALHILLTEGTTKTHKGQGLILTATNRGPRPRSLLQSNVGRGLLPWWMNIRYATSLALAPAFYIYPFIPARRRSGVRGSTRCLIPGRATEAQNEGQSTNTKPDCRACLFAGPKKNSPSSMTTRAACHFRLARYYQCWDYGPRLDQNADLHTNLTYGENRAMTEHACSPQAAP